jgi:hypothetical protein
MITIEPMRLPCGKELGSGVHALQGGGDGKNRFVVIEDVAHSRGHAQGCEGGSTMPDGARMEMATLVLSKPYWAEAS